MACACLDTRGEASPRQQAHATTNKKKNSVQTKTATMWWFARRLSANPPHLLLPFCILQMGLAMDYLQVLIEDKAQAVYSRVGYAFQSLATLLQVPFVFLG